MDILTHLKLTSNDLAISTWWQIYCHRPLPHVTARVGCLATAVSVTVSFSGKMLATTLYRVKLFGRNCRGEFCAYHSFCMRRGGTHPCTGCGIGVKSKVRLCMSCGHDRVAHRVAYAGKTPNSFVVALWNRAVHIYIFMLWFVFSSFFFYSSPNLSRRRLDVCHTSTHGVALVWI